MSVLVCWLACLYTPCMPPWDLLSETVWTAMIGSCDRRGLICERVKKSSVGAGLGHAAFDRQPNQFGRGTHAKLLAHDRGGVGDGLVRGVDEPGDLRQALAGAEQAQDLHLAGG